MPEGVTQSEPRKTLPENPQARDVTAESQKPPLIDPYARAISYLRVSVTDRCDFR